MGILGIVSLLTIGGTSYYFIQANNDPLDEFQCSIKNGPNEVTAIIFDKSQTYTNDQVTDIKTSFDLWLTGSEAITKNRSIDLSFFEQGNLIQLYVTDQVNLDKPDGLEPVAQLCVPKDFREANEWIENPILLKQNYEKFITTFSSEIESLLNKQKGKAQLWKLS